MSLDSLLQQLQQRPETVEFDQVIALINSLYRFTPTRFTNGSQVNEQGTNEGSCRIFAFAQLQGLSKEQTLACFGKFYREEVLQQPDAQNHGNIRQFMQHGWDGIKFDQAPLAKL